MDSILTGHGKVMELILYHKRKIIQNGGVAAAYAKYIINSDKYSLYWTPKEPDSRGLPEGVTSDPDYYEPYPEGAAGIDHYRSLTYPFNGELPVMINPEFIYACAPRTTGDSPLWISSPYLLGGGNGFEFGARLGGCI